MIYRLKYEKRDEVKYIGHLDTMRTFTRCIKRTSLPIKFSEGFNPRVQLSFALPLGVGVTSESEYVDLELKEEIDANAIKKELNKTLPEGFRIVSATQIEKSKSLMSLVKEAVYEITITLENDNAEDMISKLDALFSQNELLVEKQTKNKRQEQINIKELLLNAESEIINYCTVRVKIHCLAGSEKNLNPNLVVDLIKSKSDEEIEDFEIHRKELIL